MSEVKRKEIVIRAKGGRRRKNYTRKGASQQVNIKDGDEKRGCIREATAH